MTPVVVAGALGGVDVGECAGVVREAACAGVLGDDLVRGALEDVQVVEDDGDVLEASGEYDTGE